MTNRQILLVGGGGHCQSCIEVIGSTVEFSVIGIIDTAAKKQYTVCGHPVVGCDSDLPALVQSGRRDYLITIGQIKSATARCRLYAAVEAAGGCLPVVRASSALIAGDAHIGAGTIIMHQAFINIGVSIGVNGIINTGALLEHGVTVGDHCHISTKTVLNGDVQVGNRCFIGSGTVVAQGCRISDDCVVGAGSVVVRNLVDKGVYVGNPARLVERS